MSKKYHVKRREFLSARPSSAACIMATVEDAREQHVDEPECDSYHEINLQIADGTDSIWLGFEICTPEEREDTLQKLGTLMDVMSEFKRAVEREIEVLNARRLVCQHARISNAIH